MNEQEVIALPKNEIIDWLIEHDLNLDNYTFPEDRDNVLEMILRNGFVGYVNFTHDELVAEVRARFAEEGDQ